MSIAALINRSCVLLRRDVSGTDDYGNDTTTDTAIETVCEIQPRRANEDDRTEEVSEDDYVAWFLPTEDLTTADALVVDGATYEFVGHPPTWRNPRTQAEAFTEAYVRRIAGAEDGS